MNFLASSDESRNNADYGIEQEQEFPGKNCRSRAETLTMLRLERYQILYEVSKYDQIVLPEPDEVTVFHYQ